MNIVETRCLCFDDINSSIYPEAESNVYNDVEVSQELRVADEVITNMELDLECAAEKLVNLSYRMMHASIKESEFEASNSLGGDSVETLEFDLLCSFMDSQVTEIDLFITSVQQNIVEAQKLVSLNQHLGKKIRSMEVRLQEAEESLKQSRDQILEIREQSTKFQTTLYHLHKRDNWSRDEKYWEEKAKIGMQTSKQKRYILRMLEKSLAREIELENKLSEAKQTQEDLKCRLVLKEEELNDTCERWFEAENVAEIFKAVISKELGQQITMESSGRDNNEEMMWVELNSDETQVSTSDQHVLEDDQSIAESPDSEEDENLILEHSKALAKHTDLSVQLDGWNWGWNFNFSV